jgi:hypothetical protein
VTPVPSVSPVPDVDTAPEAASVRARGRPVWLDPAVRITGFVVSLGLAAVTGLYEAFLSGLHVGQTRLPVAAVLAVGFNLGLVWFTYQVTGRRIAMAGPATVWTVVMVVASTRTTEGDLVLTSSNWVALGTMLAGSVAFAAAAYRLILAAAPPPRSGPDPVA